jgi:hypothetical protein
MQDKYYQTSPVKKMVTAPGPDLALVIDGLELIPTPGTKKREVGADLFIRCEGRRRI